MATLSSGPVEFSTGGIKAARIPFSSSQLLAQMEFNIEFFNSWYFGKKSSVNAGLHENQRMHLQNDPL